MTTVAVIGVGSMGRNHVRVYSELPNVTLVGIADVNELAAVALTNRFGGQAYANYLQMLDELKPDAVSIAIPTVNHLEVALQVIARGIHLLVEKPIATSVDQANQMITAARQANVTLMIGHIERFNPAIIALKQRLLAGELGRVFQIDARRQGPFPSRIQDVGVVIDLAVHDLDVMRYITGAEINRVYAETERRLHSQHEDLLHGLVRLSDGSVGSLTINWLTPTKIRQLDVTGEKGMFRADYLTQDLYFYENASAVNSNWDTINVMRGVSEGRMIRHAIARKEPLRAELEAFIGAVTNGSPSPLSGEDGLKALALAQLLVQSGEQNRMITAA